MKSKQIFLWALVVACAGFLLGSCDKYADPPNSNGDDRLTNPYCNDPRAINYNWGFPGKPDSTVCKYPIDNFKGSWQFNDTVYLPDSSIAEIASRNLTFTSTEDTVLQHLNVTGFCNNNRGIKITADLFQTALTDTLIPFTEGGQLFCSDADTVMGKFVSIDSAKQIKISLTEITPLGTRYHTGIAIKP